MDKPTAFFSSSGMDRLVLWESAQGPEARATLLHLNRDAAAFEFYDPQILLRSSEVLSGFQIILNDQRVYQGRAIVNTVINTSSVFICEVTLAEGWVEITLPLAGGPDRLAEKLHQFIRKCQQSFNVLPEFKLAVADLQVFLLDLRCWMEQLEVAVRADLPTDWLRSEREILRELEEAVLPTLGPLFERFEQVSQTVEEHRKPAHRSYAKRQLHPLVLCSPFMYRTFQKPLGYAGDYEMVNMMTREPYEGASMFAKTLNSFFLRSPPVAAHRNRIEHLGRVLLREGCRLASLGRPFRVFNLGCGPAREIQTFLAESTLSQTAEFTLVDFNAETLDHVGQVLGEVKRLHHRGTTIRLVKKSVAQLLKEAVKPAAGGVGSGYDLVYCAGLFDYLADHICERLMELFYSQLAPGGVVLATNVDESNPSRNWMEFSVDWHLVYRNHERMLALKPRYVPESQCSLKADLSGVNLFMEVRKPLDDEQL